MKASVSHLFKVQYRSGFIFSRLLTSKPYDKIQGIRENFSEYEVRLYFNQWLKSLWLVKIENFFNKIFPFVKEVGA
jgi:hypothetical protein